LWIQKGPSVTPVTSKGSYILLSFELSGLPKLSRSANMGHKPSLDRRYLQSGIRMSNLEQSESAKSRSDRVPACFGQAFNIFCTLPKLPLLPFYTYQIVVATYQATYRTPIKQPASLFKPNISPPQKQAMDFSQTAEVFPSR
jgi:hypothetical protein